MHAKGGDVPSRVSGVAVGAVVVAAGLAIAQALGYLLNVVAARSLGPDSFGAFASLLSILDIGSVIGGGIQAVGARRIALVSVDHRAISRDVLHLAAWSAAVVVVLTAVVSPLIALLLHLDGWAPTILTALAFGPITLAGGQLAVTQGRDDFWRLATTYALIGAGKAVGAIAGALVFGSLIGAMAGLLIGSYAALAIGLLIIRRLVDAPRAHSPGLVRESLHATHALGALFVLTNVDVILARDILAPGEAGLYAVGSIVTKIAFWLPQFVGVVAFTRMTGHRGSRATWLTVASVAGIGLLVTSVSSVAATPIVRVIGGADYLAITGSVWLFAAAGSLFAVGQALLMSRIAQDDRRAVIAVWATALIVVVLAVSLAHTVTALVLCACAGALALCVIAGAIAWRARPARVQ